MTFNRILIPIGICLFLGMACGESSPSDPNVVTETGYLSCVLDDATCSGAAKCTVAKGAVKCVDVPDACAGQLTCACAGDELCGKSTCTDASDGKGFHCDSPPTYDPCAGKACGDICATCDPNDKDCEMLGVVTSCNKDGQCVVDVPSTLGCEPPVYDACAAKACGDGCNMCAPDDKDCVALGAPTFCNNAGKCVADAPTNLGCDEPPVYDACAGKVCGDDCNTCDPNDKDCIALGALTYCDNAGKCVVADPKNLGCDEPPPFDGCAGKVCGDECDICDPKDKDCLPVGATTFCNKDLKCIGSSPAGLNCDDPPPEIECTAGGEGGYFPTFDKTCTAANDCAVAFHQINCCGTQVAWGISSSEAEAFKAAEGECKSQYPGCGCPTMATEAEDGNTGWQASEFGVSCDAGQCKSFVIGNDEDGDKDGWPAKNDCNDADASIYPGAPEACDKKDNNCDKQIDEDCTPLSGECKSDAECGAGTYCNFPGENCGIWGNSGFCSPSPKTCDNGGPGVCGCSGVGVTNSCETAGSGTDYFSFGGCDVDGKGDGTYKCGEKTCDSKTEYCTISMNDIAGPGQPKFYAGCSPLPAGCLAASTPDCSCVTLDSFSACSDATGYLIVAYPGG